MYTVPGTGSAEIEPHRILVLYRYTVISLVLQVGHVWYPLHSLLQGSVNIALAIY